MKPETTDHLAKAHDLLREARGVADAGFGNSAGHCAYGAALHAAQALIFEYTDKVALSHKGVNIAFAKIAKDEPKINEGLSWPPKTGQELTAS
jgi:uncharacterized protein (UPF0332 family)